MLSHIRLRPCVFLLIGSTVLAFGLYQVHSLSGVTEGGVLGLTLLLNHWLRLSPAISGFLLNAACYLLGFKTLGREFMVYSILSGVHFSVAYALFERFPPLWPWLSEKPLAAAVLGALFVGVGAGLCVRAGGAPGGDDALAMSLHKLTGIPIERLYLASDLIVLLLSLSYIPLRRIAYSLLTVILSGQLIGLIQRLRCPRKKQEMDDCFTAAESENFPCRRAAAGERRIKMEIECFPFAFSICKVEAFPADILDKPFCFAASAQEERSLVCQTRYLPENLLAREDGWRMLRIGGTLDFSLIGVLAKITALLAENGIGIFAVSTYNTDYLWTKAENFEKAQAVLAAAGYAVLQREENP